MCIKDLHIKSGMDLNLTIFFSIWHCFVFFLLNLSHCLSCWKWKIHKAFVRDFLVFLKEFYSFFYSYREICTFFFIRVQKFSVIHQNINFSRTHMMLVKTFFCSHLPFICSFFYMKSNENKYKSCSLFGMLLLYSMCWYTLYV